MLEAIDLSLFHLVNDWCGNWALDRVAAFEQGNKFFKGGLMMIAYCWFWFARDEERRAANRRVIVAAILGTLVALAVNRAMATALPFRIRPMYAPGIGFHPPSIDIDADLEAWSSFPSDTATYFFALAFGLWYLSRPLGAAFLAYTLVWACLPRIYLGIHYPSDILVGGLLGIVVVGASVALMEARHGRLGRRIVAGLAAVERAYPAAFHAAAFAVAFEMTMVFDDVRNLLRGVVRGLRAAGYLSLGEGAALFLLGGLALAMLGIGGAAIALRRRRSAAARLEKSPPLLAR
jgi:undecaprenyl-diphosphatase